MSNVIEMGFAFDEIEPIFILSDFLENKKELVNEFKPEVQKFFVKDSFFKGPFKAEYNKQFNNLIVSLIKRQVIKHFRNFTPEQIELLCNKEVIGLITSDYFFNKTLYKDVKNGNKD